MFKFAKLAALAILGAISAEETIDITEQQEEKAPTYDLVRFESEIKNLDETRVKRFF